MARSLLPAILTLGILVTLGGGCERQPRAREREAAAAEAKARAQAREAARRAAEPLPEEPPVETVRVPNSGLPCNVDDVFAAKCRRCHTVPTRHGAPLVFLTWDDTRQDRLGQPLYNVIGRAVRTGFMPYRVEANPPVQPLTDDEKKIILDWVDAGAPRVDCDPSAPDGKKAAPAPAKPDKKTGKISPVSRTQPAP
jgi:cytochrome c5